VRPFADFSRLEFVRVVDYGITGLVNTGGGGAAAPDGQRTH
jgi:rod shape-determining protein MreC